MSDAPRYPDLAGKVALVTGGSKGIGAATVRALAANGVRVAVAARHREPVDAVVAGVREAGGEAIGITGDVARWDDVVAMRERVEAELGPVEILVLFAGGFGPHTPVHEIEEAEWHSIMDSNLTGTFLCLKAFIPGMIERRRGSIVTMSSLAARNLDTLLTAAYVAAKGAIIQVTRHVAREVAEHGIRVNCVAPGTTHSERVDSRLSAELHDVLVSMTPMGRLGQPEETASATVFLASDAAAGYLTGATIDISGGRVMQ